MTQQNYNNDIIKIFVIASLFWGVVGFAVGVFIALQLAFPQLNFGEYFTFGRLRPLHTSAVIFAFGGNVLFATSFFIVQRTCRTRLWGAGLAKFIFWGYQIFIVIAAVGYLAGVSQGKEYAEPEWYADLLLTVVWVAYLIIYLKTLAQRKEPHIYVANWFFLAFIITVAVLHIFNNLAIPVSLTSAKSYPVFGGVQSAMVQWWYGHNAVGFFLTAGFLGIVYYFLPKRANRPIYSYRLSILHFWSLIFIYIWAGPHHLFYTSLPDWAQTLGMTFSIMLWIPSWGGMINGLMTLNGAWHKLKEDHVLHFMVIALVFYGLSTFEGPLLSIKEVNALGHYTDWIIGHVHSASMGWVAFISFGALYHLVPILWRKKDLYSNHLVKIHLWLGSAGILLYMVAMWISGIMQGLMWRAYDSMGFLKYSFVESLVEMHPYYVIRSIGGILFLAGFIVMVYNVWKTIKGDDSLNFSHNSSSPELQSNSRAISYKDSEIPLESARADSGNDGITSDEEEVTSC